MASNLKIEHYILGRTLGIGAFGKVKLAKHEFSGNHVAIKIINKKRIKNNNMSAKIKREINLLRYFNHPNIIRLYEVLETQSDIFVVMEYVQNGELFELIAQKGKLNEDEARLFFQQIIAGVEYCHNNLIAHRDLKPENILIDDTRTVKVADFGLSNLMKDGKFLKTSCGSPNYAAPEVISGKQYCGTEIDSWSCGVILFALLAGFLPFDEEVIPALFKKIREADYQMPSHFSPEAQDLIKRTLQPNPLLRIKFHELKSHPWVKREASLYMSINEIGTKGLINNKLNEEIVQKVMNMGFNFEGYNENKIREAIIRKKDNSFVIAYDLMADEAMKLQLIEKLKETNNQEQETRVSLFENLRRIIDNEAREENKNDFNSEDAYGDWHYGLKFELKPQTIMTGITDSLFALETVYVVKSPNYKIKCYHKFSNVMIHRQKSVEPDTDTDLPRKLDLNGKANHDKFSKRELVFTIQIYALPSKKEYVVDIQRTRGHTILFLDYSQKFINLLNKQLKDVKNSH